MTAGDPDREARLAETEAQRERLAAQYGMPEHIAESDALALARTAGVPVPPDVTADDWIYSSIYRDSAAADAWLESNRVHHGHSTLARAPLPDGRVVGILDMRAEYRRQHDRNMGRVDGHAGSSQVRDASPHYLAGYAEGRQERDREAS